MIPLRCSSMAHVVDRAWAFLFCSPPYEVVAVRPNGVILERKPSLGIKGETLHVFVAEINAPVGEYYADLDPETNLWCVFHTETSKAYASYADVGQAKEEADKRNRATR